jgi:transposase
MARPGPSQRYPTDRTDAAWALLEPLLPARSGPRRPRTVDLWQVLGALFSLTRTGGQWRLLPRDCPYWGTVRSSFSSFDKGTSDGTWVRLNGAWRERARVGAGRAPRPSGASLDSPSVKTLERGGERGDDAHKTSQRAQAPGAGGQAGASAARAGARGCRLGHGGGPTAAAASGHRLRADREAVGGPGVHGWLRPLGPPAPRGGGGGDRPTARGDRLRRHPPPLGSGRGVARTLAWLTRNRRLSQDYAFGQACSTASRYLASIRLLTARFTLAAS